MNWFARLPGFLPAPPGLERAILRRLPRVLGYGSLLLVLPALLAHLLASEEAAWLLPLDIAVACLVILHWTAVLTVAIAAFIVLVMKGPAYVADGYALCDHDGKPDEAAR